MNGRDRFFAKVNRNGPTPAHRPELGPCHVWTAYRMPNGYGVACFEGKKQLAHRVAFFFAHGRWPYDRALHHCDNPSCVNEAHIFDGTQADNVADMIAKRRHSHGPLHGAATRDELRPRGERHGRAKLTEQDVLDIRAEYALGGVSMKELGKRRGICAMHVHRIIRRKKWAHVGADP